MLQQLWCSTDGCCSQQHAAAAAALWPGPSCLPAHRCTPPLLVRPAGWACCAPWRPLRSGSRRRRCCYWSLTWRLRCSARRASGVSSVVAGAAGTASDARGSGHQGATAAARIARFASWPPAAGPGTTPLPAGSAAGSRAAGAPPCGSQQALRRLRHPSAARAHRRRGLGKRQPAGPAVPVMPASRRSPALDRAHASPRALCHRLSPIALLPPPVLLQRPLGGAAAVYRPHRAGTGAAAWGDVGRGKLPADACAAAAPEGAVLDASPQPALLAAAAGAAAYRAPLRVHRGSVAAGMRVPPVRTCCISKPRLLIANTAAG